ncbi:hypothetical protein BDA96_05G114100 [Sorghum bicolor]|nr:hypothetical protein BDA96_05G114100 [Sorghum bicolor]OQU83332.1 hypothetical protein SORBI_3005G109600 [Sorghum bicolor]
MSHRFKAGREIAHPSSQSPSASAPWWGAAMKPQVAFPPPVESVVSPPGWWAAASPEDRSFVSQYGTCTGMGAIPIPDSHGSMDASTNSSML